MKKVFNAKTKAGSKRMNEPRQVGSIVEEMLQGWNRNTELSVELKTILRNDRTMKTGKDYVGVLRRDREAEIDEFSSQDAHYSFIETVSAKCYRRNPHVFDGEHITITRRADGTLHPNFKPMPVGMSVDNYAFEVYDELRQALKGLVEE